MNDENTKKLIKRFPHLYRGYYSNIMSSAMPWGFQHGDGWFNLIWQLSLAIEEELKHIYPWYTFRFGLHLEKIFRVYNAMLWGIFRPWYAKRPITEKGFKWVDFIYYGLLRVDRFSSMFEVTTVKEKYASLRYYTNWSHDAIDAHIDTAEIASHYICERCGQHGKIRGHGWYYTSCMKCSKPEDLDDEEKELLKEQEDRQCTKSE